MEHIKKDWRKNGEKPFSTVFGSWRFAWKKNKDISRAGKGGLAA
jgi:hypothetical protein